MPAGAQFVVTNYELSTWRQWVLSHPAHGFLIRIAQYREGSGMAWGQPALKIREIDFDTPESVERLSDYIQNLMIARQVWLEWNAEAGQPIENKGKQNA